jgi:Tol biopolymer transport system component
MRLDGTGRQMLTDHAVMPQWSPDGRTIAFMESNHDTNRPTKIRVISAEGGPSEQIVQAPEWQGIPTWTPDGTGLVFGENGVFFPITASCSLHVFNFRSKRTSNVPGSTGLWTARACPTGRYIAAVTRDNRKIELFDQRTAEWRDLAAFADSPIGANPTWSRDGKFLYVDAPESPDPSIYRISIPGGRRERVVSLKGIQRVHGAIGVWIGLTPDNLPLILRAVQSSEVWGWDWLG